jgi:cytochrome c
MNYIGKLLAVCAAILVVSSQAIAADEATTKAAVIVDADAAEVLARREGCLKCHGATKDKEGPSFKKVAAKYKDKADAEARLLKHVRSGDPVKFSDGEEEDHRIIRSQDEDAVMNLIRWILSR